LGPKFRETVAALHASDYGNVFKAYAAQNWLVFAARHAADSPLRKNERVWEDRFWELFERLAGEHTPSADTAVLDLAAWREKPTQGRTRRQNHEVTTAHLEKGTASKDLRLVAEAEFLRREAWDERGTGAASTVRPEAWKVYNANLTAAREKLEAAWAADKTRPRPATDMVNVCRN
jgi:hypothetical protein